MISTVDPRTGATSDTGLSPASIADVETMVRGAASIAREYGQSARERRAELLEAIAASIEADRRMLIEAADQETALGEGRLNTELSRTVFQFGLFRDVLRDGGYLEAMIDHGGETVLGPAPDLRRMLVPLGPVAVFGASNFPFAFSVLGGDTASALAAGCPVVIKAHGSHPLTSQLSFEIIRRAAESAGTPASVVSLIHGQEAGIDLVRHPEIRAVGFTGSLGAARALEDAIGTRRTPIPFFGELSSLNPVVVTSSAARARGQTIARGLFSAFTGSGGQLCTKPGVVFVPRGEAGDHLVRELVNLTEAATESVMLNARISRAFSEIESRLVDAGAVLIAEGSNQSGHGFTATPTVLMVDAERLDDELAEECFGPLIVVARYSSTAEVTEALARLPHSLAAAIHGEPEEGEAVRLLSGELEGHVGRIVFDGFPSGVRVSWAQNHGGPWPATNSAHTSVGATSIRRWLRPLAWQDALPDALPPELRDGPSAVPRRVDGRLELASTG